MSLSSIFLIPSLSSTTNTQQSFTSIKTLIENPILSKHTSLSQLTSYITYNKTSLYELGIKNPPSSSTDFIKKIQSINTSIKVLSSSEVRSLIIKGVNKFVPWIDIYTVLAKVTPDLKKVTRPHIPIYPGIGLDIILVEYEKHESVMKALESINAKKKLNVIKGNIEAFLAEPLIDNAKLYMESKSSIYLFENIHLNTLNVEDFKQYIESWIKDETEVLIQKLRVYINSIVIEFNCVPKYFSEIVKNKSLLSYNGRNIPVNAVMKPIINCGKYKQKLQKRSVYVLNEENKKNIYELLHDSKLRGGNNKNEDEFKKKCEAAYNKLLKDERKEYEREQRDREQRQRDQRDQGERDTRDPRIHSRDRNEHNHMDRNSSKLSNKKREHSRDNNNNNYDRNRRRYSGSANSRDQDYHYNRNNNNNSKNNKNEKQSNHNFETTPDNISQLSSLLNNNPGINQLLQVLTNPNINLNQLIGAAAAQQQPQPIITQPPKSNLLSLQSLLLQSHGQNTNQPLLNNSNVLGWLQEQDSIHQQQQSYNPLYNSLQKNNYGIGDQNQFWLGWPGQPNWANLKNIYPSPPDNSNYLYPPHWNDYYWNQFPLQQNPNSQSTLQQGQLNNLPDLNNISKH